MLSIKVCNKLFAGDGNYDSVKLKGTKIFSKIGKSHPQIELFSLDVLMLRLLLITNDHNIPKDFAVTFWYLYKYVFARNEKLWIYW